MHILTSEGLIMPKQSTKVRSPEMIRQHYVIEKELAGRLRTASKNERRHLYTEVYDELFRRVPDHPQLALKPEQRAHEVNERLALLRSVFMADRFADRQRYRLVLW